MSRDPLDDAAVDADDLEDRKAENERPSLPWSAITTVLSTLNMASLISFFVGLCYFYNHSYRAAYLGPFGLETASLPLSFPDAVADGFIGLTANVMMIVVICAGVFLVYVVLVWLAERCLNKLTIRPNFSASQPLPHPALAELGKSFGFRASLITALVTFGITVVSIFALFLVGLPAEHAAAKDVTALRGRLTSDRPRCARFRLKGNRDLVGWRIGGTAERQYILGNDDAVHILKFDELDRLQQSPVPCRDKSPAPQKPRVPGGRRIPVAGV